MNTIVERDTQIWLLAYWYVHEASNMYNPERETMDIWNIDSKIMELVKEKSKEIGVLIKEEIR